MSEPEVGPRPQQPPARCFATNRILLGGKPVGRMYRDDGWIFLAGDEDQEFIDNPNNTSITSIQEIARHDPAVAAYLTMPEGSDLIRVDDQFVDADTGIPAVPLEGPALHPQYPIVHGRHRLTERWSIYLAEDMNRRVDDESLVLWRPGFTIRFEAWLLTAGETHEQRIESVVAEVPRRFDERRWADDSASAVSFRVPAPGDTIAPLFAFVFGGVDHLIFAINFDRIDYEQVAYDVIDSLRYDSSG